MDLYKEYLKYSYKDLQSMFQIAKSKEEKDFYATLLDLKLQQAQAKLLEK